MTLQVCHLQQCLLVLQKSWVQFYGQKPQGTDRHDSTCELFATKLTSTVKPVGSICSHVFQEVMISTRRLCVEGTVKVMDSVFLSETSRPWQAWWYKQIIYKGLSGTVKTVCSIS